MFKSLLSCFSMFCNEVSDTAQHVVSSCYVPKSAAQLTLCPRGRLMALLGFPVLVLYSLGQGFGLYSPAYSTPRLVWFFFVYLAVKSDFSVV